MCSRCSQQRFTTLDRTGLPGIVVLNPLLGGASAEGLGWVVEASTDPPRRPRAATPPVEGIEICSLDLWLAA